MKRKILSALGLLLTACMLLVSCDGLIFQKPTPQEDHKGIESVHPDVDVSETPALSETETELPNEGGLDSWVWGEDLSRWETEESQVTESEATESETQAPDVSEPEISETETPVTSAPIPGGDPVDEDILDTLPVADYGGKIFNIALPNASEHGYQFDASRITGNLETDAIYRWKKQVQDTYNMTISYKDTWDSDYFSNAGAEIAIGISNYHLYGHYAFQVSQFVIQGYFQDWKSLEQMTDGNGTKYLDLSAERWDRMLNDEVTYNGKLLTLTGDLGVSKLQSAMATFVNTNLLEEYCDMTQNELYALVNEGKWTFEEFKRLAAMIYEDDSVPGKSFGDTLGYLSTSGNSLDIWLPAFNLQATRYDGIGTISPTLMEHENVIDELRKFYYDGETVMMGFGVAGAESEISKFRNEELGFCTTRFANVYGANGFNNMQSYGIVPTPKWSEGQEVYRTKLNDRYTIWGISACLLDSEKQFTAHITDALCAESSEVLYYQFYEVLLKNRYSRDPAFAAMVDKVMEHPSFDTVIQFSTFLGVTGNMYAYLPRDLIVNRGWDMQDKYDDIKVALEYQLQTVYNCYR